MVYLLHLLKPLGKSRHYIGWAKNDKTLYARLDHHRNGKGANFTKVCVERGITWVVAKIYPNEDKRFERNLKGRHGAGRFCPICILEKKKESQS